MSFTQEKYDIYIYMYIIYIHTVELFACIYIYIIGKHWVVSIFSTTKIYVVGFMGAFPHSVAPPVCLEVLQPTNKRGRPVMCAEERTHRSDPSCRPVGR